MILATIHVPQEYVGPVIASARRSAALQRDMHQHGSRVQIRYELPLSEVVVDFHDRLKSATRGYGSFDYELIGYKSADLVKLDILVNGDPVDALSLIVHRDKAQTAGRELAARKLKEFIPRQMFEVAIQAAIGAGHRAHQREGPAQERDRQVLRRRHHAQAQAPGEAEGRKEAHEEGRAGRDPAGGVPGRALKGWGTNERVSTTADRRAGRRGRRGGGGGPQGPGSRAVSSTRDQHAGVAMLIALAIRSLRHRALPDSVGKLDAAHAC